jgi:hypothetical protein
MPEINKSGQQDVNTALIAAETEPNYFALFAGLGGLR